MVGDDLTVLVTDDYEGCRELYTVWLADDHEVLTATDGEETMARLSDRVDVVLLDRDMPGPTGTEVAHAIADSEHDPYVVMVSSKPMDFDVVEIPVDGYVRKPIEESDLRDVIDDYRCQRRYEVAFDEYFALTEKLAAIEADRSRAELADDERYHRLRRRVEAKRAEVDEALDPGRADWTAAFKTIDEPTEPGHSGRMV